MRTETVNVYTFSELPEQAQERAIERWRAASSEYDWNDEWRDCLKIFCDNLGIKLKDWSISPWGNSYINAELITPCQWDYLDVDPAEDMRGLRLRTWLINNWLPCFKRGKYYHHNGKSRHSNLQFSYDDLTGFCGDYGLIQPILKFIDEGWMDDRISLNDLLSDCLHTFMYDWIHDMEYQNSDEYIRETIEANEYEFYADGSMA
jgi:hypothetical protein